MLINISMRAREFLRLIEGYKEAQIEFEKDTEPETASAVISQFKDLVNKNQVLGNERNIDFWRKQGWSLFQSFVSSKQTQPTKTQIKRKKVVGKSINLADTNEWLIVIPLDKHASCFHGKNSDWCTTKVNQSNFESYFYANNVTLIYCINKQSGKMWAIAGHKDVNQIEMFDQRDTSISHEEFNAQTGLNAQDLVDQALNKHSTEINSSREKYNNILQYVRNSVKTVTARDPQLESALVYVMNTMYFASYVHALITNQQDVTLLPEIIKVKACEYDSRLISKLNLPETAIVEILKKYGDYIRHVPNPTPAMIHTALERSAVAVEYVNIDPSKINNYPKAAAYLAAKYNKENPEVEPKIAKDNIALLYYLRIKKTPFPEAEPEILKNPTLINMYVMNALHRKPWDKGEEALLKLPNNAHTEKPYQLSHYAAIVKRRWPEAEATILTDPASAAEYAVKVLHDRWPAAESGIIRSEPDDGGSIYEYADEFEWYEYFDKYEQYFNEDHLPEWFKIQSGRFEYYDDDY